MITIGDKRLQTRRPANLDEVLLAATGCSAAEVAQQLRGDPLPGHIARALRLFLGTEAPAEIELAAAIADAGTAAIGRDVADLLKADAPAEGGE